MHSYIYKYIFIEKTYKDISATAENDHSTICYRFKKMRFKRWGFLSISVLEKLMVFKSIHGLAPQYMGDLFTKISQLSSHNLRNTATDLRLPQKRSSNGLKCFSYRGAKTWNSLPTKCKQAITTRDFKSYL